MTMAGGNWTPTTTTPPPGSGPLTSASAAGNIMTWLADNVAGDISALDMRNSFDLVLSLLANNGGTTIVGTAGVVPAGAGAGQTDHAWPAGHTPNPGDIFVNTADALLYLYGPPGDPTAVPPTAAAWHLVGSPGATVTITSTKTQTPATNPPLGRVRPGDVFVNNADQKAWIYATDPATPGAFLWEPIATGIGFDIDALLGQRNVPQYDNTAIYPKGALVLFNNHVWLSKDMVGAGQNPGADPVWRPVSLIDIPELHWPPAPDWGNTHPYQKGELAWYDDKLWRALVAIPDGTVPGAPTDAALPAETFTGYEWRHTGTGSTTGFHIGDAGSLGSTLDHHQFHAGDRMVFYWIDANGDRWGDAYVIVPPGTMNVGGVVQAVTGIRMVAPGARGTIQQGVQLANPGTPANALDPIISALPMHVYHQGQPLGNAQDPATDATRWALVSGGGGVTEFLTTESYDAGELVWFNNGLWFALRDRIANGETPDQVGQTTWQQVERMQVHHQIRTLPILMPMAKPGDFYIDTDHPAIGWLGDELDPNDNTPVLFTAGPFNAGGVPGSDAGLPPQVLEDAVLQAANDAARLTAMRQSPGYGDAVMVAAAQPAFRADQYVVVGGHTWHWDGTNWQFGPSVAIGGLLRHPVFTEELIRRWIAEAQRFQGTVQEDVKAPNTPGIGNTQIKDLMIPSPSNQGQYYVAVHDIRNKPVLALGAYVTQAAVPTAQGQLHVDAAGGTITLWSADNAGTDRHTALDTLEIGDVVRVKAQGANDWWDIVLTADVTAASNSLVTLQGAVTVHGTAPADGTTVDVERRESKVEITRPADPGFTPPIVGGTYTLPDMKAGDWLMSTGDPNSPTGGWAVVPGGVLTISLADTLYVKRTDTQLLVPVTRETDWVLMSRPGAAAVWTRPVFHEQVSGAVVDALSGLTGEISWSQIDALPNAAGGQDAGARSTSRWPFVQNGQDPLWDPADGYVHVLPDPGQYGAGSPGPTPADFHATHIYVSSYTSGGALSGDPVLPDNIPNGGLIRLVNTGDGSNKWADYRITGHQAMPNPPGTQGGPGAGYIVNYSVELVATGPGGHPDMRYSDNPTSAGWDIRVSYVFDAREFITTLKPGALYTIADGHDIPDGVPGIGGKHANPGDLIRAVDSDGNRHPDRWELLAPPPEDLARIVGPNAEWGAGQTYPEGTVVSHGGHFWIARAVTNMGDEPGVSNLWESLRLDDILAMIHENELPAHGPEDAGLALMVDVAGELGWDSFPPDVLNGPVDPIDEEGQEGNWYLNTDDQAVWLRDDTTWTKVGSLRGGHNVAVSANAGTTPMSALGWGPIAGAGTPGQASQYKPTQQAPRGNGDVGIYTVGGQLRIEFWPLAADGTTDVTARLLALQTGSGVHLTDVAGANTSQGEVTLKAPFQVDTAAGRNSVIWAPIEPVVGTIVYDTDFHDVSVTQGLSGSEGGEFVNTVDRRSWVHDGTSWVELQYDSNFFSSKTIGMTPERFTFPTPPQLGDIFSSVYDDRQWIARPGVWDPNARIEWQPLFHPVRELWITIPTSAGSEAVTYSDVDRSAWGSLRIGEPMYIREVQAGKLPNTFTGLLTEVKGLPATPGDWLIAVDADNSGVADAIRLVRQRGSVIYVPDGPTRLALTDLTDGTLVVQQDTGWTWRFQQNYVGHAFWSPWRVFSDYVGAATVAARDALAPHIHIGTLVSVGQTMYQYVTNPDTSVGQPPGIFIPFGDHVFSSHPPEGVGPFYLDRGLGVLGVKGVANNAVTSHQLIRYPWEALITGVCRQDTELYLVFHATNMGGYPDDAPVVTRGGFKCVGPWKVKGQRPWMIEVKGNVVEYGNWLIEFTGQDTNGRRVFDRMVLTDATNTPELPVFGISVANGNVYINRAVFQMSRNRA